MSTCVDQRLAPSAHVRRRATTYCPRALYGPTRRSILAACGVSLCNTISRVRPDREGGKTHAQPQNGCIMFNVSLSRSFIARAATCSTVVWLVLMSTTCVMSIADTNTANKPDLACVASLLEPTRGGRQSSHAQDNRDDVLRVEGRVRARGSARIESDERGERPEVEEHGPYDEHEEKLAASTSQLKNPSSQRSKTLTF
jgi:hypothetical protein